MFGKITYNKIFISLIGLISLSVSAQENCAIVPNIADPWIQKFGDWYYMVGTPCPGDWEMQWVGMWKSRDLVNWSGPVCVFEGEERDRPMWASEIHRKGDEYFIITTCNTWNPGNTFMLQKADAPDGNYSFHSFLPKRGLDPSLFTDTDGKTFLLDSEWIAPLDSDWKRLTGDFIGHRDNKEGPFMIKNNNIYMRFFARIDDTYFMEMESTDCDTPYTDTYQEKGVVLDGKLLPGHGCLVASPDGSELWYASHVTTDGWETRRLGFAPMEFDSKGNPVKSTRDLTSSLKPSMVKNGNIAKGKPVNSSNYMAGCLPSFVTDGINNTFWQPSKDSNDTIPIFLEIDLISEFDIASVTVKDTKGKKIDCDVLVSCDRKNWEHKDFSNCDFGRFVRLQGFSQPGEIKIGEVEIYRKPYTLPQRGELIGVYSPTALENIIVPESALYDIEFIVESLNNHSSWNLYDNGSLIGRAEVASTGPSGNKTKVINYDVPLSKERTHNFKIVPTGGNFKIENMSIYSIK